jgi:hypothetical protein
MTTPAQLLLAVLLLTVSLPVVDGQYPGGSCYKTPLPPAMNGTFEIVHVASGKCLDPPGGSLQPGNKLQIWSCDGLDTQLWRAVDAKQYGGPPPGGPCGDTRPATRYVLTPATNSSICVDIPGRDTTNGMQLQLFECAVEPGGKGGAWLGQVWQPASEFWPMPGAWNGDSYYPWETNFTRLGAALPDATAKTPSKCMDLQGGVFDNGTPVEMWDCQADHAYSILNQVFVIRARSMTGAVSERK